MDFWQKIAKDVKKGFSEGMDAVREGATAVRDKTVELTEEGQRKLKAHGLKTEVQKDFTALGGRVYALSAAKKSPLADTKVKAILARIGKRELQIRKLEGK